MNNINLYIDNQKNKFRNYCIKKEEKTKFHLPLISEGNYIEAILIEMRPLKHLSFLIKNAIYRLGSNVSITIICGNRNLFLFEKLKKEIQRDIRIINLGKDNLTREEYSIMLLNSKFWRQFLGEKLIIFQEDTIIFRNIDKKFIEYDYIGAPLEDFRIGNGGLSLRSKNIMIKICEEYFDNYESIMKKNVNLLNKNMIIFKKNNIDYLNRKELYFFYLIEKYILEDCNFTDIMRKYNIGKIAPFEIAREFSVEKFKHISPFGGHAFWYCISDIDSWLNYNLKY